MDRGLDSTIFVEPAVRARLWVSGYRIWPPDDCARLWLVLSDGRVLALRLGGRWLGRDEAIAPIVAALADAGVMERVSQDFEEEEFPPDLGTRDGASRDDGYALSLPELDDVFVLNTAPVVPTLARDHAVFVFDPDFQSYVQALDREVVALLASLERPATPAAVTGYPVGREPHPPPARYLASIHNYNRLVTLPLERRLRRLQALRRFPPLVAPVLLALHHSPNYFDGKRHVGFVEEEGEENVYAEDKGLKTVFAKDECVEAAVDQGRDLVGALARFWGISRGLVRSPINALMWGGRDVGQRRLLLAFLDALPANKRPFDVAEFECWMPYLVCYLGLLGEEAIGPSVSKFGEVHRNAFHLGWRRTWETAARRYGNLLAALADCKDFLDAVCTRAARILKRPEGPRRERLAAGWLACHGLLGLLDASARWHRSQACASPDPIPHDFALPQIVGRLEENGQTAQELVTPAMLKQEGMAMRHCVGSASYWEASVSGARLFHLDCRGEKATAFYRPRALTPRGDDVVYKLEQLRGPCNREASKAMQAWARRVAEVLNEPARQGERRAALLFKDMAIAIQWQQGGVLNITPYRLDPKTERQLARVLAWLGETPPGPDVLLVAHVAGFEYHDGPKVRNKLAVGDPLDLVLDSFNPHHAFAVRLDWQGHKLGYLPRPHNAEIAARLMAGARLAAHIAGISHKAKPWRQVEVVIRCEKIAAA